MFERVTFNPEIMGGRACIRGMRIPVSLILNLVANVMNAVADMGMSLSTVEAHCQHGHDAVHLRERRLQTLPDSEIVALALAESRIIATFDLDFADLMAVSKSSLPSVVIFRLRNHVPQRVSAVLIAILEEQSEALSKGALITVAESGYRVRHLPLIG